ncbi:MAG: hypothetical protein U5R49_03745 [Deltaproteobacteria bacterium]|nr:hypothetical protein [Deltaproteobacteria bacterium]
MEIAETVKKILQEMVVPELGKIRRSWPSSKPPTSAWSSWSGKWVT